LAGNSALQEKLRQGIEAARKGDKATAQKLLRQVTAGDANNEVAWMWLASVSETLQERRACLEQTLRINPNNRRAQQALEQLSQAMGVPVKTPSGRAAPPTRRPAAPAAVRNVREGGLNPGYIIVGVLALLALVSAFIFSSIANSQPQPPNQATLDAAVALQFTATPSPTIAPEDFTATPFLGIIVTPANLATLPPSFTPTFTPTATFTPPPSQTPFPIAQFSLLYTSASSGLFTSSADGTGAAQIGAGAEGFIDAAYSPDGQRIAFVREVSGGEGEGASGSPELFIAPADDLEAARQLTTLGGTKLEHPTFAPDGIQIVFVSDSGGNDDLWYITEDGNNLRPLTTNPGVDKDPAWSPNGDVILYASDQANRSVVTIPPPQDEGESTAEPVAAPDPGLTEIFSITPDGATIVQITDAAGSSFAPAWSPTGEKVVFVTDRNGDGDIYMIDPDGQLPFLLTVDDNGAEDRNPAFTPDGKSVAFLSNREDDTFKLYSVDLESLAVSRLIEDAADIESLVFKPIPLAVFAGSS